MLRKRILRRRSWVIGGIICSIMVFGGFILASGQTRFYDKSLHNTSIGMRNAYERKDGLMKLTKIPYDSDKLDCKQCHVQSCDTCHVSQKDKTPFYSTAQAKDMNTCLKCHGKEGLVFHLCKQAGTLDVHVAQGMTCVDCHTGEDVHGDGIAYQSMREPGAVKAACENCHEADTSIKSHTVHQGKLDCTACHVSASVSCMNCHMDTFVKTGSREGIFFLANCYLLLMNRETDGKVACGTAMSFVTKNKKFIVYSPQYSHAIQKKGKACGDCHANEATKLIRQGELVPMMVFKEGKLETWKGVVPAIHESLQWTYLNKEGDTWIPLPKKAADAAQTVQWWYAKPITKEQLAKLSVMFK